MKNNTVLLAHGTGGDKSNELIRLIKKNFNNKILNRMDDAGVAEFSGVKTAFSTDSFVIDPIFFNGGDIGKLAVCGTVNDICMMGAKPLFMSVAMIIEEGFSQKDLLKISQSIAKTAKEAKISIITGDTKVVDKGKADKIFINTSAVGLIPDGINISSVNASEGDDVIISGNIAEHAAAIMMQRNDFKFKTKIKSDCAHLDSLVQTMLKECKEIHVLRDPTRGGLAAALNEISKSSNKGIIINNDEIPVSKQVRAFCKILGLDPLYMANEGKLVSIQPSKYTAKILNAMRKHPSGKNAKVIGKIVNDKKNVWIKSKSGILRILANADVEQYPRIC
ncbi:MAG: hydrogenase expression/formation protein HypE [Endomicrobiaceae bacterium]|nr:hydrogenase expression/formation protein HypE [Endomicrobiaceae bacterium]MDD3730547.1 hydrogenase expression/formation protein HypE [Endomicrobiaceae bacterium]MDD4166394.1 hydrogenase expression/formation protein HypE [Endomicrobiaceae bacterium]